MEAAPPNICTEPLSLAPELLPPFIIVLPPEPRADEPPLMNRLPPT